jgi:hypothetical protein
MGRATLGLLFSLGMTATLGAAVLPSGASQALGVSAQASHPLRGGPRWQNPFCLRLGKTIQASAGAQAFCFGAANGSRQQRGAVLRPPLATALPRFGTNVDAADFAEDVTLAGVRGFGQSETSLAAVDSYVVEAWNDATAFFAPCPSPGYKEEGTGYAFSIDEGRSFVDLGGLPNNSCATTRLGGDPSVVAYKNATGDYFYISSLYNNVATGVSYIALSACQAAGSSLFCGQPIPIAQSSQDIVLPGGLLFYSFLDKDFLTIDARRGRLYAAYTEFSASGLSDSGRSEMALCDIGTPTGTPGTLGGTAATPVCPQGAAHSTPAALPKPYLVLSSSTACENEGNYPDVDKSRGDVYDSWEYNWSTNFFSPCNSQPTVAKVARVPWSCLNLAATSSCTRPASVAGTAIVSLDSAFIPGYNRFPMNDFPRLAVSERYGTACVVWNDSRTNLNGDILLQSFRLGSLAPVQFVPTRLNDNPGPTFAFLPALRNENRAGRLNVAWYDRRLASGGAQTDVFAALDIDPTTTTTPHNARVTDVSSDWLLTDSDISPNYGDYTDENVVFDPTSPTQSGYATFVAWSDGRYGVPQPFAARSR